jgi:hypothetical protein
LLLVATGWWRSTGVGPQVQVPMFYDDHYIYPRPWTQEQEAPGVPDPAVIAFYGPNRLSQPFTAAADQLALLEIWLAGPAGSAVELSLVGDDGLAYGGTITLEEGAGKYYRLSFPAVAQASGRSFRLTLAAPGATAEQPILTRAVGGDRLGGSLLTNEYSRPGNLELYTYSRALPGRWWLDSLMEQLLPAVFRLRLQQYKPAAFKAPAFPLLLLATALLTGLFLLVANWKIPNPKSQIPNPNLQSPISKHDPIQNPKSKIQNHLGWSLAGLLLAFLLWQGLSGRLLLPGVTDTIALRPDSSSLAISPGTGGQPRLVQDLTQTLWTAERKPEPRFVTTTTAAGYPTIRVPADSSLDYALTVPPDGRLRVGLALEGRGQLRFNVRLGEQLLDSRLSGMETPITWLDLDLQAWAGQPGPLRLQTEFVDGQPNGLWLMPQLLTSAGWLLADPLPPDVSAQTAGHRFGETVELAAYQVETGEGQLDVDLYWRVTTPTTSHATVFVHLLDSAGNIIAQHDGQPVNNSYPLPNWQPGMIIADRHLLPLAADVPAGPYQLAVGLYDPATFARWPVTTPSGEPLADGRALLPLPSLPSIEESGILRCRTVASEDATSSPVSVTYPPEFLPRSEPGQVPPSSYGFPLFTSCQL